MTNEEIFNEIISKNNCFVFHFTDHDRAFFYTNNKTVENDRTVYTMCEMLAPEEIALPNLWNMSEGYLKEKIANHTIQILTNIIAA